MNITWLGLACFKIEGSSATIVIDPYGEEAGLKLPRLAADIVISSKDDDYHGNISAVAKKEDSYKIINGPGEYEAKDVLIYGISMESESGSEKERTVIYKIQIDGITIVHLGALPFVLADSQLDHLDKTDILMIGVGGGNYIKGKDAAELVNQIEPRVVIPMLYKTKGVKGGLSDLSDFCKVIGICPKETLPKYKIAKKDLPSDETKVVLLDA